MRSENEIQYKILELQRNIVTIETERDKPVEYNPEVDFPPPYPVEYYNRKIDEVQERIFLLQWVLGRY